MSTAPPTFDDRDVEEKVVLASNIEGNFQGLGA